MAKDAAGMRGYRSRNQNGELRDKRDDTHMGSIEKKYERDFSVRDDMHLGTFLKEHRSLTIFHVFRGGFCLARGSGEI